MYQHDWFQVDQTQTRITPDPEVVGGVAVKHENIARWLFTDSDPLPVAYAQLVLKGLSQFDHSSRWAEDW